MSKLIVRDALAIFKAGVDAVRPETLIRNSIKINPVTQMITPSNSTVPISVQNKNIYVVGMGKAVKNMAIELEGLLTDKIRGGFVSIPTGSLDDKCNSTRLQYFEGADSNLPDTKAETTAKKVNDLAMTLGSDDILLVLISGGGSALLPFPRHPITLDEKTNLIKKLANAGADIKQLNVVRKKLSDLKGGKLALKAQPARVVSLILSDIVGDPLDLIASGPTTENLDAPNAAKDTLEKFNLLKDLPDSIKTVLEENANPETFPQDNVTNIIIGSNKISLLAAKEEAERQTWSPIPISNTVTGNVKEIAEKYAKLAKTFHEVVTGQLTKEQVEKKLFLLDIPGLSPNVVLNHMQHCNVPFKDNKTTGKAGNQKGICLLLGGEITVEVNGSGKGGRNQHLALEFSNIIHTMKDDFPSYDIYLLSAGTDGIDGPTDAAGAIGYLNLVTDATEKNINIQDYLDNSDSYNFYKKFDDKYHIVTGHTNTNVMDLHILLLSDKRKIVHKL